MSAGKDSAVLRGIQKLDWGQPELITPAERKAMADNEGTKHLVRHLPPFDPPLQLPAPPSPTWDLWLGDINVQVTVEIGCPELDYGPDSRCDPYDGQLRYR